MVIPGERVLKFVPPCRMDCAQCHCKFRRMGWYSMLEVDSQTWSELWIGPNSLKALLFQPDSASTTCSKHKTMVPEAAQRFVGSDDYGAEKVSRVQFEKLHHQLIVVIHYQLILLLPVILMTPLPLTSPSDPPPPQPARLILTTLKTT